MARRSQKAKRLAIEAAKNKPCVDCVAEGRRADWPLESMTLDHLDRTQKTMWFSLGSDKTRRTGGHLPYTEFTLEEVLAELDKSEAVCSNHQNIRTRRFNMQARRQVICAS